MRVFRSALTGSGLAVAALVAFAGSAAAYTTILISGSTSSQGTFYPEAQIPSCAVQYGANQGTNEAWAYPVNNCNLHDVGARAWYTLYPGSAVYYTNIAWGHWGNHTTATGDIQYAKGYMGY
jgi:hypothetical protein